MHIPSRYPGHDSKEQESLGVLLGLVNSHYVKVDMRTRDKFPNVDGIIEIVDEDQTPVAKFDVQLKSIPEGQAFYDCPRKLAEYSNISTLPILLVCVDSASEIAFWKHITMSMPQYRSDQKTFRIQFAQETDRIDERGFYIARWTDIAQEYQARLATYEDLKEIIQEQIEVSSLPAEDIALFQSYIDALNSLLDGELAGFKTVLFPGTWKLGVSVFQSGTDLVGYQLYRIPRGKPAPLVVGKLSGLPFKDQSRTNVFLRAWASRESLGDPVQAGRRFALDKVDEVVEKRALRIFSSLASSDTLFGFIDRYYSLLGMEPHHVRYEIDELEFAMNTHLIDICSRILWNQTGAPSASGPINLDQILLFFGNLDLGSLEPPPEPMQFAMTSGSFPLRAAFSALDFLTFKGVEEITRTFPVPDFSGIEGGAWIWQGYMRDQEIDAVTNILSKIIKEYEAFVSGNRLGFHGSPYLDPNVAIVYQYEPLEHPNRPIPPIMREFHVCNQTQSLPKCLVVIKHPGDDNTRLYFSRFPDLLIDKSSFEAIRASHRAASFFFQPSPVLSLLYEMLQADLERFLGT